LKWALSFAIVTSEQEAQEKKKIGMTMDAYLIHPAG
jgi:hypothetical protein